MSRPFARSLLLSALLFLTFAGLPADQERASATDPVPEERDGGFVLPQIILGTQKQPVYPPAALDGRYSGHVLLEMTVLKNGKVGEVKVVECNRPRVGFEDAAVQAVKQWRFDPGTNKGEPIDVVTRLRLNFNRVGIGMASEGHVSAGSFTVANQSGTGTTSSTPSSSSSSRSESK